MRDFMTILLMRWDWLRVWVCTGYLPYAHAHTYPPSRAIYYRTSLFVSLVINWFITEYVTIVITTIGWQNNGEKHTFLSQGIEPCDSSFPGSCTITILQRASALRRITGGNSSSYNNDYQKNVANIIIQIKEGSIYCRIESPFLQNL
jgi:hypothetical protein